MNTKTCRATNSDPAFVSSSFGNAEDQAICKPVNVAPNAAGFDARVADVDHAAARFRVNAEE